jgi:hypothetical protein
MQTGKLNLTTQYPQMQFTMDLMPERTGVRIWGSRMSFYDLHRRILDSIGNCEFEGKNRVNYIGILYSFAYDVRHTFLGDRLVKCNGRFVDEWDDELIKRFEDPNAGFVVGVEFSWPQLFFTLASLRECYRHGVCPAELLPVMLDIETNAKRLLKSLNREHYDLIAPYVDGAVYAANPYLLHVMERVDKEYDEFHQLLLRSAVEKHCDVADLGLE